VSDVPRISLDIPLLHSMQESGVVPEEEPIPDAIRLMPDPCGAVPATSSTAPMAMRASDMKTSPWKKRRKVVGFA
jgi:hypothetical protein